MDKLTGLEIAVVGMAGRFPGAKNLKEFWTNLSEGKESITFFSDEELKEEGVKEDELTNANYIKAKGIIEDYNKFDSEFFGYSDREAEIMDPQVRIFHEVSWEALEDAGYNPEKYNRPIGLFGSASANLYWQVSSMLLRNKNSTEKFAATQLNDKDFMNTKVSYNLNLKGPSISIDTACSSSLSAIHLASRSLLMGECTMALAGGVSLTTPHKEGYIYQDGMIMSKDGHCRTFDKDASGTVGGEGCGVVVLKTLKEAKRDRDHIYSVIKGSAYNNDGYRKVGYTAPSVEGQKEVIKKALKNSRVSSESISYVEAHGTATSLGDPVEVEALKQAFDTNKKQFCALGSVKTNIGHLDSAAGIAGFIKTVLSLYNKEIVPSLHYKEQNTKINFDKTPFFVNTTRTKIKEKEEDLYFGVSSFGVGGTNVHLVLGEYSEEKIQQQKEQKKQTTLLISAKTEKGVNKLSSRIQNHLKNNQNINCSDATFTLREGRKHFDYRQLVYMNSDRNFQSIGNVTKTFYNPKIIWMFSGQGAQYLNMGKDLYKNNFIFQENMKECFSVIWENERIDLENIIYPSKDIDTEKNKDLSIENTLIAQLSLFCIEYSLSKMLMKIQIYPNYLIGHSLGEISAATIAGVIEFEDAISIIKKRGEIMQKMPSGEMATVNIPKDKLESTLIKGVEISAINSTDLSVVSGNSNDLDKYLFEIKEKGYKYKKINVSHAFHSSIMKEAADDFEKIMCQYKLNTPNIPILSNVTGEFLTDKQAQSSEYWASQIISTVQFQEGIQEIINNVEKEGVFIEIGPGNTLIQFLRRHNKYDEMYNSAISLIRHPQNFINDIEFLEQSFSEIWKCGVEIDWSLLHKENNVKRVSLPTYPFESKEYPTLLLEDHHLNNLANLNGENSHSKPIEWLYRPVWKRNYTPLSKQHHSNKNVLVFSENEYISEFLRERYAKVITFSQSNKKEEVNSLYYQGDVGKESDLNWVIDRLNAVNFTPDEIVWVHDEIENNEVIPNYAKILNLIKLLSKRYDTKICINLITSQAYDVIGNEDIDPLQATLTGVAFTISQEYKNLYSRQIDISAKQQEYADIISREIEMESKDIIVAYRGKNRWTRELIRLEKEIIENININPIKYDGVYLITGGTGGIGLTLAEHLAKNNKCKIILMGRTEFSEKITKMNEHEENVISKIKEIEALGSEVSIIEGDVSIRKDVQKAIEFIMNIYSQLNGVIHAAGSSDGKLIQSRDTEYEKQVCAPKINGLYNLDGCLKGINLDFLMLCSSLVSFMESAGQVAYVASNAFLDSFAQKEQKNGKNVISINWDKWKEVGMSANSKEVKEINELLSIEDGIGIEPSEAGEIFQHAIQLSIPQVGISKKNIDLRLQENRKILNTVLNGEVESNKASKKIDDEFDIELRNIFNEFLNEELDMEGNFFELGVSSLDLLQICGLIEREYGIEVPIVTLYNHPNIISLSNEIKNNIALKNYSTQKEPELQTFKNNDAKKRKKSRLSKKGRGNIS